MIGVDHFDKVANVLARQKCKCLLKDRDHTKQICTS